MSADFLLASHMQSMVLSDYSSHRCHMTSHHGGPMPMASYSSSPATSSSSAASHGPAMGTGFGFQASSPISGRRPMLGLSIQIPADGPTDATAIEGEAARHEPQQLQIAAFMHNGPPIAQAEPAFLPQAPWQS